MEESKKKLYVEPDGFWTEAAILFMVLAIVFRLIGSIGRWNDMHYLVTLVALPIFSGMLFILCLLFFSKRAFWTTVVPVVFGIVFFIFRIMGVENEWQKVGCIGLYVVIVVLYAMAFSHPRLKWALAAILALVFAYHVGIQDMPVLMNLENPVSFVDGMQELSVLGIILSLLSVTLAMKMTPRTAKSDEEPETSELPEKKPEETPVQPEEEPEKAPEEKKLSRRERRKLKKQQKEQKPEPTPETPEPESVQPQEPETRPESILWIPMDDEGEEETVSSPVPWRPEAPDEEATVSSPAPWRPEEPDEEATVSSPAPWRPEELDEEATVSGPRPRWLEKDPDYTPVETIPVEDRIPRAEPVQPFPLADEERERPDTAPGDEDGQET